MRLAAEAELARRLLLQGRGGERRERVAADLPAVDFGDRKARGAQDRVGGGARLGLAVEIEAIEPLAVEMGEPRGEGLACLGLELDLDRPVFARFERLDLGFALADQAQCDGLDAAGRAAARKLAPEHRRQGETDEVIERPAGKIGFDQLAVDLARPAKRLEDGVLRHLVEDDPLDVEMLQRPAGFQHLVYMPGDRLALAVGVGGEEQAIGAAHRLNDRLDVLFGLAVDLPRHRKIRVREDRAVLGRQIADMAIARDDLVVAAKVLVDGFRLRGRFDDDDFHEPIRSGRQGAEIS